MNNNYNFSNQYLNWIKERINQTEISSNVWRISTPFLNRNNDFTEIYIIKNDDDSFKITDNNNTISDLIMSGYDPFSSSRRQSILESTLGNYGVQIDSDNGLYVYSTLGSLPVSKHMLIQCILRVDDMFILSKGNVKSLFLEDVSNFLDANEIRYIRDASFIGKSNLTSTYDFAIASSNEAPERMIKTISNFDLSASKNIIFSWNDIVDKRPKSSTLYVFINDESKKNISKSLSALKKYNIKPVLWSDRENSLPKLIA